MKKFIFFSILFFNFCVTYAQPTVVWSKYFGGDQGEAKSIQQTADGGYIVAGVARNPHLEAVGYQAWGDGFVVKVDAEFNLQWSKCYGSELTEYINMIKPCSDGGYVFVGMAQKLGYSNWQPTSMAYNAWIVKIDATGAVQWEKKYGGSHDDEARSVDFLPDGALVVTGYSRSVADDVIGNYGMADYWIIKLDASNGEILTNQNYGGEENDFGYSAVANPDGTTVAVGESFSESVDVTCRNPRLICESDIWVIKTDGNGEIIWNRCFGSNAQGSNFFNIGHKIIHTIDGGYAIVGSGRNTHMGYTFGLDDLWIIKIDANGYSQWKNWYGGSYDDRGVSIKQTSDGGFIVAGDTYSDDDQVTVGHLGTDSKQNGWVIKVDAAGQLEWQRAVGSSDWGFDYLSDIVAISLNEYIAVGKAGKPNDDCSEMDGRGFWITKLSYNELGLENQAISSFQVSPNPVQNILNLTSVYPIHTASVVDIAGRQVLIQSSDNITEINLAFLSPGIYYLQATAANGILGRRKIIKI